MPASRPNYQLIPPRIVIWSAVLAALTAAPLRAEITPDSPEVKRLIDQGMAFLEENTDERLGGKCLVGLCHIKHTGDLTHRRVVEAIEACDRVCQGEAKEISVDIYSTGIAIFFLCEVDAEQYGTQIEKLVQSLVLRQKLHGGFGYPQKDTGDTSMTQYAVLGLWTAKQHGIAVPQEVAEKVCNWLIRTQDPSGAWGYQGNDPNSYQRVKQQPIRPSLSAAGLGSTYIASHMLGLKSDVEDLRIDGLPAAFRRVPDKNPKAAPKLDVAEPRRVRQAQIDGNRWFAQNFGYKKENWVYYYMYALERCMSFRELVEGREPGNAWYEQGVKFLTAQQAENGSWLDRDAAVDTAFAVLFLMRGTKKTIEQTVHQDYDGLLLGGRGLPKNTASVRVEDGVLVGKSMATSLEDMLRILADPQDENYRDILRFPPRLDWDASDTQTRATYTETLRKIAAQGAPDAQVRAIEMLAALGDLQSAPTLIAALTDDDLAVTLAARDGLRRISRKFGGFGLSDRPKRYEILQAADKWRAWYRSVAPDAN